MAATLIFEEKKNDDEDNIDAQAKVVDKRITSGTKFLPNSMKNYTKVARDSIFNSNLMLLNLLETLMFGSISTIIKPKGSMFLLHLRMIPGALLEI